MRRLRGWLLRFGGLFRKQRDERELSDEMESHLLLHIEDNLRSGMNAEEARRSALIRLGGMEQTKEEVRGQRGLPWLEVFFQDLRFGARMLGKNPGFTAVAALTLALGIGANATIFSFISAVIYQKPTANDPDRLMVVYSAGVTEAHGPNLNPVSAPNFFTWKKANRVFSDMAAGEPYGSANLTGQVEPERLSVMHVTANYFSVLGVAPALGRTFLEGEDRSGHEHEVVLSHEIWERKFGSDSNLIGTAIKLNGEQFNVVGVMPAGFLLRSFQAQIWTPMVLEESQQSTAARETRILYLFGRLKDGVSVAQAEADISTLGQLAAQNFPEAEKGWAAATLPLQEYMIREFNAGAAIAMLMSAVGFVLLIACANIAGLLVARAASRGKEMAIRVAIGAGRGRLIRQLLTEALLIALLGGAVGLAISVAGARLLQAGLAFSDEARALSVVVDQHVLLFTAVISLVAAILFGLAPALQAGKRDVYDTLKNDSTNSSSGRSRGRFRSVLVAGEVALAVILLTGTSLIIKGVFDTMHQSLGFEPAHLLTAQISLGGLRYKDAAQQSAFYQELTEKLKAVPGVQSAAAASDLPATGANNISFRLRGQEAVPSGERPRARYFVVDSDYFRTMEIPLVAGRNFSEADGAKNAAVAMVSEVFVKRFFPKGEALGKSILIDAGNAGEPQWREIIGVVGNVKNWPLQTTNDAEIYEPFLQRPVGDMAVAVRTTGNPAELAPALRETIWSIDKDQPIGSVIGMPEKMALETTGDRLIQVLLGIFAGLAMLLSGVGLYGLVSYSVGQRRREIGIRVAMGAEKTKVLRLVLGQGIKLALIGAAVGVAGALPLPQALDSLLQDFHAKNAWMIFVLVPSMMALVALLACYIPARRASQVDPIEALRYE